MIIYGYLIRIRSSRRLEAETKRNVELMWLLEKLSPDFKTIADLRKENKKALVYLFRDFTRLCNTWQLYGKELIAIDGTKFRACNSKRNNYSAKKLARHIRYIDEKIESYLTELTHLFPPPVWLATLLFPSAGRNRHSYSVGRIYVLAGQS